MPSSENQYVTRQKKLSSLLRQAGLDALILNPGSSLVYLSGLGFHLMERPVVGVFLPDLPPHIILPELETQKLTNLPYQTGHTSYGEDPSTWPGIIKRALAQVPRGKIGVENNQLRLLEYRLIESALQGAEFVDAGDTVAALRMYKDENEISHMQSAVDIAEAALEATLPLIKVGMSEQDLANELVMRLLQADSDSELPFQPIVSTGPNGANPHASPGERKLDAGDLLVIDYGARSGGYISDITRTFAVAEYSQEQGKVHKLVQQANAAGRAAGKPGLTCGAVDQAARQVIEQAGYGDFFTHRTGHGIGMEPHEGPYIRGGNSMLLQPGMTFTIEPGIYLPERFGVRIEDNVVVTTDGLRSLTKLPRELRVVG